MSIFDFTIFCSLDTWLSAISYIVIAKILLRNWKINLKEVLYVVFAGLIFATIFQISQTDAVALPYTANLFTLLFIFFYFFMIANKKLQIAFIYSVATFVIALFIELLTIYIVAYFYPDFPAVREVIPTLMFMLLIYMFSVVISLSLVHVLLKRLSNIMQVGKLQSIFALVAVFIFIFFQVTITIQHYAGHDPTLFSWNAVFILSYIFASLACFGFYAKFQKEKAAVQEKEAEHRTLLFYMDECEHQQSATRKFKHDYQNILISIDGFLEDDDLSGLKEYFLTKIKPAYDTITQNEFALEGLGRIKVREIRGILSAKLMMAHNLGIDAEFQITDDIDHISADSIILVRMFGIILDNAIEALTELNYGKLIVACYKTEHAVIFVVQNTCSSDLPPYSKLKQSGFSTKADGRGLGLSILWELADSCPNITLRTSIADGNFTQKLSIKD